MSSHWRIKSDPADRCLTFEQLAQAVATGELTDTDLVQPDYSDDWHPVYSIPGLDQAVRRQTTPDQFSDSKSDSFNHDTPITTKDSSGDRQGLPVVNNGNSKARGQKRPPWTGKPVSLLSAGIVMGVLCLSGWKLWSWRMTSLRFPRPSRLQDTATGWWFPFIGQTTGLEFAFLCFDVVILLWITRHLLLRMQKASH
jgi:hypothetical protein